MNVPSPGPGETLVRISCCTICGSDIHTFSGLRKEPMPSILGHEVVGVVEQVGSGGAFDIERQLLQLGDRVTWSVAVSCFECDRCLAGLPQKCRSLAKYGHALAEGRQALSGGLAEFILLRRGSTVVKLPDGLANEVVCPSNCATSTIAACFRQAASVAQKRVLIFGAGMLGLTATAFAAEQAASQIVVVDTDPQRLQRSTLFGATANAAWNPDREAMRQVLLACCASDRFDIVLELSGAPQAVSAACELADVGGKVILAGSVMPTQAVALDPEQIVRRCLSIHGVHNYAPQDLQTAVEFLGRAHMRYPFDKLVERTFPLAQVNEAMQFAQQQRPVRIAVCP